MIDVLKLNVSLPKEVTLKRKLFKLLQATQMSSTVITTFYGYFLVNCNISASNGYFTLKMFLISYK